MPEPIHKKQLTLTVCATPLMTSTTDLGLSIRLSIFELRETRDWDIFLGLPERARAETGDWDIFLGPLERARAETAGADQWVLKRREFPGVARVNEVNFASLGYPLSVFNKNSTLKQPSPPLLNSHRNSFENEAFRPKPATP